MGNNSAINRKVAEACKAYSQFKLWESALEEHKKYFKDLAKQTKQTEFENAAGDKVKVSPHTTNYIQAVDFEKLLKSMKLEDKFTDCVSVKIGEAKKLVGETQLSTVTKAISNAYGKCNFKPSIRS